MPFDLNKSWLGVGGKTSGMLIGAGMEHTSGIIVRGSNTENLISYSLTSARVGLGLGASFGLVGIMIFNCEHLGRVSNTDVSDWGVNVAVGERWGDVVRAIGRNRQYVQLLRMVWRTRHFGPHADGVRNILHYVYSTYDFVNAGTSPKVFTFDIPMAGIGAELSASYSTGRLSFD